jgi:integrase/recombinase XerC
MSRVDHIDASQRVPRTGVHDWCGQYLASLAQTRRLSAHTLRSYQYALSQLAVLARHCPLDQLTPADIRAGTLRAHAQGLSARSIAHRLTVWRCFYRWLARHTTLVGNPVSTVRAPGYARDLPKALSVDDAHTLMVSAQKHTSVALRDRAMIELFYSSGLRLAELIELDIEYIEHADYRSTSWLDCIEAQVHVTGKGGRRRTVPVGRCAIDAINAWRTVRAALIRDDPTPLFLSVRGQRMSPGVVRKQIKHLAMTAGIPTHVHPHVLRHSFASHLLQSSGDLRAVQEMLGHTSIVATQVYTALDFQHLAKVYDKAHPRAKK